MSNITQMNTTKTVNIFRPDGLSQRSNADIAVGKEAYENITIGGLRELSLDGRKVTKEDGNEVAKIKDSDYVYKCVLEDNHRHKAIGDVLKLLTGY